MSHSAWKPLRILKKIKSPIKKKNKSKTQKTPCVKSILAKHVISLKYTTKHNCPEGKYPLFYYLRSLFSAVIMSLGLQFLAPKEITT